MRTDEELKKIAEDLYAGRIYSDRHIPGHAGENALMMVFTPFAFMDDKNVKKLEEDEIDFVFEYLDKAGPRTCNGMPSFFSFQRLTKTETKKMFDYYDKIKAAIGAIT